MFERRSLSACFLFAALLSAGVASGDVTGTWSGTLAATTRCNNGVTRNDPTPLTLGLVQTGNDVTGVATIEVPELNAQCQIEDRFTVALPLAGSFTGNTLNLRILFPDDDLPFIDVTATPSGSQMTVNLDAGDTTASGTLTRTSSQPPSGGLTGTYSVTATMKPTCPNGSFQEDVSGTFTLTQAGSALAGIGSGGSTRHVDYDQVGRCFYHEVESSVPLFMTAVVSGNTITGVLVPIEDAHGDDGHEEDINEIEFTATVSGNRITGGVTTPDFAFSFTMTRTSSALAPTIITFIAEPSTVSAGRPVTLRWETFNATSVTIDNGIGTKPADGSVTVTPSSTTTYRLTANSAGGSATASTSVTVHPVSSSRPCDLSMTFSCSPLQIGAPATCTATTVNHSAEACSGTFLASIFFNAEPSQASLGGYNGGLGLQNCFTDAELPGFDGLAAFCFGQATLPGGGQFTQTVSITPTSSAPPSLQAGAMTLVFDEVAGEEKAFLFVADELTVPGCIPALSAPAVAQSGGDYVVSWTASRDPGTSFTLEESTTADFSANVTPFSVAGLQRTFRHDVTANTTYYYRARPNNCPGGTGAFSEVASTVVQAPLPTQIKQAEVIVPFGSRTPVSFPFFIPGSPGGTVNFTATADQPFITITPASGTVPTNGTTITVTVNPTDLPPGANTGTVTVVISSTATKGGPVANNGTVLTSAPITISLVTPVTPGGKSEPPPNSLIIPVVTHVNGATGPFLSDVRLVNTTGTDTTYKLLFTPTQSDGTKVGKATEVTAKSGQTLALNDVVKDFFGFGATGLASDVGFGVLEIRPLRTSSTRTFASSRTYVRTVQGTLGQFIAAVPFSKFARRSPSLPGQPAGPPPILSLQQVAQSLKFRTNFGIVEGSGFPANGRFRLFDSNGTLLSEVPWSLLPGEHKQMNGFIRNMMGVETLEDGRIEVIVDSNLGAVTAYASVLDNKTTDPMAVMPIQAAEIRSRRYTIPGMAEFGGANNFHSDVRVYNGGSTSVTVTPTFYTLGDPSISRAGTPFTVAAGEVKVFDNVLPTLFGAGVSGGSIVFSTPEDSSLVVTGRTYTIAPDGGTYGQFIPGLTPADGMAAGSSLQLLQLEQSQNYRTNVGLVEVAGQPATVRMTFSLPDTKTSAIMDVDLAANHYTQLNQVIASVFGPGNYYNVRIGIEVLSGGGRVSAYGSVLDNATLDPTYVPSQ